MTSTAWPRIAPILPEECVTLLSSVLVKQGAVGHSIALLVVHSSGPISCFLLGANEEPIFNPCFGLCFSKEPWLRQSIIFFFLLKSEQKQTGTEKLSTRVLRDPHLYLCAPFSTQPFCPHSHGRAAAPAALSSAWQEGRKGDRTAIGKTVSLYSGQHGVTTSLFRGMRSRNNTVQGSWLGSFSLSV